MGKFVSRCTLTVDNEEIDDFTEITEPEVEQTKPVPLMHKTGHMAVTRRYQGIKVKYVIPEDAPEFDFSKVADGTLTISYGAGMRRVYSGVYCTKIGGETYKDGSETVRDIELSAEDRNPA